MKQILFAILALTVIVSVQAMAAKPAPVNAVGIDQSTASVKMQPGTNRATPSKAITRSDVDTVRQIRTTLSPSNNSIACVPGATAADDTLQIAYLQGSGNPGYQLWHGYSVDGGATWTRYMVDGNNAPRYPSILIGDNDPGNSVVRPAHMAFNYQTTNELDYVYESSSMGDNAWSFTTLVAGQTQWFGCIGRHNNQMMVPSFMNGGAGTTWWARSYDMGQNWIPSVEYPVFGGGANNPSYGWMNDTTIIAFLVTYNPNGEPTYFMSYDSGATFTGPVSICPTNQFPQYRGDIYWYGFDGMVTEAGVPHFLFVQDDFTNYGGRGYSGAALFHATPKNVADLSQGWNITHVSELWDTSNSMGYYPMHPSIGVDAAGNIYAMWLPMGASDANTDVAVSRSTDNGATWTAPLYMGDAATENLYPSEIPEVVGSSVHVLAVNSPDGDVVSTKSMWHYDVPVADIAAMPVMSAASRYVAPFPLQGVLWTGDAVNDTMTIAADDIEYAWQPGFAYNGTYEVTISLTPDWSVGATNWDLAWQPDSNTVIISGLPGTGGAGTYFYKVRSVRPDASTGPWSGVYTFTYTGAVQNNTDWVNPSGVTGNPTKPVNHSFALGKAYPNPASKHANLSFTLPKAGAYSLKVYNIAGQVVKAFEGRGAAGSNSVTLDTRNLANGVFFFQLTANGNTATRKLTVVR